MNRITDLTNGWSATTDDGNTWRLFSPEGNVEAYADSVDAVFDLFEYLRAREADRV